MNAVMQREDLIPQDRLSLYSILLLTGFVTLLTVAAVHIYPTWDDGRILVLIGESGLAAIQTNYGDRPIFAFLLTTLFNHHLLFPVGILFHWFSWVAMGLITMHLWRLMFPSYSKLALLPALLSVAPVLCKVQFVLLTIVFLCLLGPVLTFLGTFLLLRDYSSGKRRTLAIVSGLSLIMFSVLLSQYSISAAAIGFVLLIAKAIRNKKAGRHQTMIVTLLFAVGVVSAFLVFSQIATTSPEFRPSFALQSFRTIELAPFRLVSALYQGTIGVFLQALGGVTLASKRAVSGFISGLTMCGLVAALYRTGGNDISFRDHWPSVITLLVAAIPALIPLVLMDRTPGPGWDSRFWLPLLPVLSTLTVFGLLYVVRRRLWLLAPITEPRSIRSCFSPQLLLIVPIFCGFLARYWAIIEAANAFSNPGGY